jgi:hypothetical protein
MPLKAWADRLVHEKYGFDGYPLTSGKRGCIFVLRVGQMAEHPVLAGIEPDRNGPFLEQVQRGLSTALWRAHIPFEYRSAAAEAIPRLLEFFNADEGSQPSILYFWSNALSSRDFRGSSPDGVGVVALVIDVLEHQLHSPLPVIRRSALNGLLEIGDPHAKQIVQRNLNSLTQDERASLGHWLEVEH